MIARPGVAAPRRWVRVRRCAKRPADPARPWRVRYER